jgi:DNA-binding response OmpR family regulator
MNSNDGGSSPSVSTVVVAGELRLAFDTRELRFGGRSVLLEPDIAQLLRLLMEERGCVVTRTRLMTAIWGAASIDRAPALEERVNALRAAAGNALDIETVTGIGYRLV